MKLSSFWMKMVSIPIFCYSFVALFSIYMEQHQYLLPVFHRQACYLFAYGISSTIHYRSINELMLFTKLYIEYWSVFLTFVIKSDQPPEYICAIFYKRQNSWTEMTFFSYITAFFELKGVDAHKLEYIWEKTIRVVPMVSWKNIIFKGTIRAWKVICKNLLFSQNMLELVFVPLYVSLSLYTVYI